MTCCDCGLVHRMDFRVMVNNAPLVGPTVRVRFRAWRDEKRTKLTRRKKRGEAREQKAVRLFLEGTRTIDEIAVALDLTRRCVERAIREALRGEKK